MLPVQWAATSLPVGGLMALAFWAGMGTTPLVWRLVGTIVSCAYAAVWPTVTLGLQPNFSTFDPRFYLAMFMQYLVLTLLIAVMFAAMRVRFQIRTNRHTHMEEKTNRVQFTVFHLLVLTSFTAVVLTLMRGARGNGQGVVGWQLSAALALIVIIFFVNTACAVWAVLGSESIRRNCLFVFLASILLGSAVAFAAKHDQLSWSLFAGGTMITMLPTIGVMLSLLWLRPCGIRIVRRQSPRVEVSTAQLNH
jgi:hypothetical protein